MCTDRIQKMAVMGYDKHRIFIIGKVVFQPHDRIQVQVIRRLVQQKVIRLAKQGLRQQHPHFLFSTQIFHERIVQLFLNP